MEASLSDTVCIRPSYVWPAQPDRQLPLCTEEGICIQGTGRGQQLAALFSGCGPNGTGVAVAASQLLVSSLTPQWLQDEQCRLAPASLEAAFQQCHQQLLQLQHQPDAQQQLLNGTVVAASPSSPSSSSSQLDVTSSGTSALLLALDQNQGKLLVASAGLCKAVLARSSPAGDLTVMELTPRLALGHDPTETARLDAAGSSICYQIQAAAAASTNATANGAAATAAAMAAAGDATAAFNSSLSQGFCCSTSCSLLTEHEAVLVAPDGSTLKGVGASRLLGFSNATRAGVSATPVVTSWRLTGSEAFVVLGSPGLWQAMNPAEVVDYVAAALASGIGIRNCCAPAAAPAAEPAAAADDAVAAAAPLCVGDLLTLEAQERLKLKMMDRLFGLCPGPSGVAGAAGVVPDVAAVVLLMEGSPALRSVGVDEATMAAELRNISRACRSNAEAQAVQALWSASCFSCDKAVAGPPAPALSSLLPALSVAGHCWPSALWPAYEAVRAPAPAPAPAARAVPGSSRATAAAGSSSDVAASLGSSSTLSFEEAAAAAGVLRRGSSKSLSFSCGGPARSPSFALSSRLSCELDLSHHHGSHGSCGCLAGSGECSAALSESPSEQQSMIVHKVRLAGPCELESLLFGSATTSYPDTTVARILKPSHSLTSWPSADTLSPSSSSRMIAAGNVSLKGHHVSGQHQLPRRSASVSIASLAMRHGRISSSGGSSSGGIMGSLREAALAADQRSSSWNRADLAASSSLYSPSSTAPRGGRAMSHDQQLDQLHMAQQQQQQQDVGYVKKARSYQALSALQAAGCRTALSMPVRADQGVAAESTRRLHHTTSSGGGEGISAGMALVSECRPFRSAFKPSVRTKSSPGEGSSSPDDQATVDVQHGGRPAPGVSASAGVASNVARLVQQQLQQQVCMPLSCPAEGLGLGLAAEVALADDSGEGKVRGGLARGRQSSLSSFRVSQEEAAAAASAAEALQSALAALADKQHEGKVKGGIARDRRSNFRPSQEDAAASASAAEAIHRNTQCPVGQNVSAFAVLASQGLSAGDADSTNSSSRSSTYAAQQEAAAAADEERGSRLSAAAAVGAAARSAGLNWTLLKGAANKASASLGAVCSPGALSRAPEQQQQQQQLPPASQQPESCVRGGRGKAARMTGVFSSPDLPSLAAASAAADAAFDAAAVSAVRTALKASDAASARSSWDGAAGKASKLSATAAGAAAAARGNAAPARGMSMPSSIKHHMRLPKLYRHAQKHHKKGSRSSSDLMARPLSGSSVRSGSSGSRGSSMDSSFTSSNQGAAAAAAAAATAGSSVAAAAAALAAVAAAYGGDSGAAAGVGSAAPPISREPSACYSDGSGAADGAVHGGELGEEALEGQMHGGRRSSSLTLSGSMLLPSLSFTSSAGEDGLINSSCTSPAASGLAAASIRCIGSPDAQQQMMANGSSSSTGNLRAISGEGSSPFQRLQLSSSALGLAGLSGHSSTPCSPQAGSQGGVGGAADGPSPSIQVLRMPSGSFTRVRLAASAPAAGAAGDAAGTSLAGSGAAADLALGQQQSHYTTSCVQLQHYQGQADGRDGFKIRRVSSSVGAMQTTSGSVGGLDLPRSRSSGGGGGSSSSMTPVDGWTTSRAWGSNAARRSNTLQFGKVAFPAASNSAAAAAAAAGAGAGSAAAADALASSSNSSGNGGGTAFSSAFSQEASSSSTNNVARVSFEDVFSDRQQQQGLANDADAASSAGSGTDSCTPGAAASGLVHAVPAKRQRSMPLLLPTLQESPAPTPGTSPEIMAGSFIDSYAEHFAAVRPSLTSRGSSQDSLEYSQDQQQQHQQRAGMHPVLNLQQQLERVRQQLGSQRAPSQSHSQDVSEHNSVNMSATGLVCSFEEDGSLAEFLSEGDVQHPESPPCRRSSGRSFEFSRPHPQDACYTDSPAPMGNMLLLG